MRNCVRVLVVVDGPEIPGNEILKRLDLEMYDTDVLTSFPHAVTLFFVVPSLSLATTTHAAPVADARSRASSSELYTKL